MKLPKRWNLKTIDESLVREIAQGLKVSLPTAKVLANRGIASVGEAELFVDPDKGDLHNPFLLPDMGPAIARISRAVDGGEKILVYGDRDVDGITSICILVRTLRSLGADPLWYIPSDEGYGVHNEVIERYSKLGVTLIVTVDCGISAVESVKFAGGLGIDVVITDHHEPAPSGMPEAVAVVDPKRVDSKYPFVDLAGCAVSFKVSEALMHSFGKYFNTGMVFLGASRVPGNGSGCGICAVKQVNGLYAGKFEFKFSAASGGTISVEEKEGLKKFSDLCKDAVIVSRNMENMMEEINRVLKENGIGEVSGIVIDIDDYLNRQSPGEAGAGPRAELSGGSGSPEEIAYSVLRAYLLAEAADDLRMKFFRENNIDAVALGTIADIMPLVKENRLLVKRGLKMLANTRKAGLKMLIEKCGRNGKTGALSAKSVSWSITPVLNAAGRRGKADLSCELLLTDDPGKAEKLIGEILQLNNERKELQAENLEKFIPMLKSQCDLEKDKIFVVTVSGIEHGVTGIIASQIMRKYRRPTVLLIVEGGEAMGAARSFEGFDILGAISKLAGMLVKYGGHSQAAGLTIATDRIDEFRAGLKAIADREISPETLVPSVDIDAELEPGEVTMDLIDELARLEPFGMGNPNPVFSLKNMKVRELSRMGSNSDHLKLKVSKNGSSMLGAVGWGLGFMEDDIMPQSFVDLAVQLELNTWQDRPSVQMLIEDVKPSES